MFAFVEKLGRKRGVRAAAVLLLTVAALFVFASQKGGEEGVLLIPGEAAGSGTASEPGLSVRLPDNGELGTEPGAASAPGMGTDSETTPEALILVDVEGAVTTPGVVTLAEGSRVFQAVELAGGVLGTADASAVNLARILADGEQIYIPTKEEAASGAFFRAEPSAGRGQAGKVNLNTATGEELQSLSGVGPVLAEKILEDRRKNGPFQRVEDLKRVSGIGEKTFEKLKDKIAVQ